MPSLFKLESEEVNCPHAVISRWIVDVKPLFPDWQYIFSFYYFIRSYLSESEIMGLHFFRYFIFWEFAMIMEELGASENSKNSTLTL